MGITGLRKLLNVAAPGCIKTLTPANLRGMKIAIDISILVYATYHVGASRGIVGSTGLPINHIQGIFHKMVKLIAMGATVIAVFDGKPPELKNGVLAKRRETPAGVRVPQAAFNDVKRLLQLMKIPYIDAPSEAEAQAAHMCREGVVDAVLTEDYDVLVFGAPRMLIFNEVGKGGAIELITLEDILSGMSITGAQFIDLCILLGSDYTAKTLRGVGPKTGLKLVKKHGTIENILAAGYDAPVDFTYAEARMEFIGPNIEHVAGPQKYKITAADVEDVNKFLLSSGLDPARYSSGLSLLRDFAKA